MMPQKFPCRSTAEPEIQKSQKRTPLLLVTLRMPEKKHRRWQRLSLGTLLCMSLLSGSAVSLYLNWDPWAELCAFHRGTTGVSNLTFSDEGSEIIAVLNDGSAYIVDAVSGKQLKSLKLSGAVWRVALSPDRKFLAEAPINEHLVRIWDVNSGNPKFELPTKHITSSLHFSRDSLTLLESNWDTHARIWDLHDGRELHSFQHENGVLSAWFSANERAVHTRTAVREYQWDLATGESQAVTRPYPTVACGINESWRLIEDPPQTWRLINILTGKTSAPLAEKPVASSVRSAHDGSRLVMFDSTGVIWEWDTVTGERHRVLGLPIAYNEEKTSRPAFNLEVPRTPNSFVVINKDGTAYLYVYRRPDTPWGFIVLPLFWFTAISALTLASSIVRDWKTLK